MRKRLTLFFMLITLFGAALIFTGRFGTQSHVYASESEANKESESAETKGSWKQKKGKYYYYGADKKKYVGIREIGGKKYYFDKKGVQRCGWQKIGNDYYFFRIKNGKGAYMISSETVNQIKLKKNGRAKITKKNRNRLNVLVAAQSFVQAACKKDLSAKKFDKLKMCWDYFQKTYRYVEGPDYTYNSEWPVKNANYMFTYTSGDCMHQGAAFAFIANACGYTNACSVSSGGHGWAEVNGRVFDPSWAKADTRHNYFNMKMSLSGVDGRPAYRPNRKYVYKI